MGTQDNNDSILGLKWRSFVLHACGSSLVDGISESSESICKSKGLDLNCMIATLLLPNRSRTVLEDSRWQNCWVHIRKTSVRYDQQWSHTSHVTGDRQRKIMWRWQSSLSLGPRNFWTLMEPRSLKVCLDM